MDEARIRQIVREEIRFSQNTTPNDDAKTLQVMQETFRSRLSGERVIAPGVVVISESPRTRHITAKRLLSAVRAAKHAFIEAWTTKPRHRATCANEGDPATCPCNTTRWTVTSASGDGP